MSSRKIDQSFPTWSFDQACQAMEWNSLVSAKLTVSATATAPAASELDADLVIVSVYAPEEENDDESTPTDVAVVLDGITKTTDEALEGALMELMTENAKSFKHGAKLGSLTPIIRVFGKPAKRYAVMGLGKKSALEEAILKGGSGMGLGKTIAGACDAKKIGTVKIILPESLVNNTAIVQDLSTYFYQTLYADNRYRTGDKIKKPAEDLKEVMLLAENATDAASIDTAALEAAIDVGQKMALGVMLAKDIVNAPHNVLNSESLAETAKRIAAESKDGRITCKILEKEDCEALGMGAYLSVARGSETRPQFIHLIYTPPSGEIKCRVGCVGKGLLFDTGGYNIKVRMMELMKFDCGGSAAVLGAARAIGELQPPGVEAHFIVAACENMINEKAYVPSDILTAMNGKTIEVMNTDAEGRLTLADALCYADKEAKCDKIIELSTLTGTCIAFLGRALCACWTDDDALAKQLDQSSQKTGDKVWRMPLEKEYMEQMDSLFADMKNLGGPWGGPVHAALFLTQFVDPKKPFAHLDIAGPVWNDKLGATGYGAKLVTDWVIQNGKD